jgi:prolyl 4-hydroxylase
MGNPINAFVLLKRLTTEWKEIEGIMKQDLSVSVLKDIEEHKKILKFPEGDDLAGAATAVTRLQDTYKLKSGDIVRGYLNGKKYSSEMTPYDCFELGRQLSQTGDDYYSTIWLREAYNLYKSHHSTSVKLKGEILDYLQHAMFKNGEIQMALSLTNDLLELYPDYQTALNNKAWYAKELERLKKEGKVNATEKRLLNDIEIIRTKNPRDVLGKELREKYEALCRGEVDKSPNRLARLKCRYQFGVSKFLVIAPLKVEEVHLNPLVLVFHDVIYDSEIRTIKRIAKPRFRRAVVFGGEKAAHYRISKSGWIKDHESKHIRAVSLRVQDMSQMTVETAEELQVVNYGIGGQYEPHYDFKTIYDVDPFANLGTGNRVATTLFYVRRH